MNKITLNGRLTNDIEVKTTNNGIEYARFSIACNSKRKNADGSKKTDFFNCSVFGKGASIMAEYCHKGDQVLIVGSMDSDKRDNNVYWNCVVEDFEFVATKGDKTEEPKKKELIKEEGGTLPF